MRTNYIAAISGGLLRAHSAENVLARSGDYYALHAKWATTEVIGGLKCQLSRRLAYAALSGIVLGGGMAYVAWGALRGNNLNSGPIELVIYDDVIDFHYRGDRKNIGNLNKDLGNVARQLFASPKKLPDTIVGVSNRDMTSYLVRKYGIASSKVDNYPYLDEVLRISDAIRAAEGRKPCPDRNAYAISIKTEEFIDRFAFPSHYRGQNS